MKITHRQRACIRAFTLIHMVVIMPMIGIFLFIASHVFITNNTLVKQSVSYEERLTRADLALNQLRTDAWLSTSAKLSDDGLTLNTPTKTITWRLDEPTGDLERAADDSPQSTRRYEGVSADALMHTPHGVVVTLAGEQYFCPRAAVSAHGEKP